MASHKSVSGESPGASAPTGRRAPGLGFFIFQYNDILFKFIELFVFKYLLEFDRLQHELQRGSDDGIHGTSSFGVPGLGNGPGDADSGRNRAREFSPGPRSDP